MFDSLGARCAWLINKDIMRELVDLYVAQDLKLDAHSCLDCIFSENGFMLGSTMWETELTVYKRFRETINRIEG